MAADPARTTRSRVLRVVKVVVVLGLLVALALSVRSQWSAVRHDLARLPILDLIFAILLAIAGTGFSLLGWRALLADLGSPLRLSDATRIFSLSQLGKYIPGSVWPVVAQMELGRKFHIPRLRSATAFLLTLLGSLISATAIGGLLAFTSPGWGRALGFLPLVLLLMHPRILVPLTALIGRLLRRPAANEEPSVRGVARAVGWLMVQWVCFGSGTALMAHGLGSDVSLTRCIAATALSWAAGLVVIPLPAGAGVREGVLTFLLASSVGSGRALTLALLGRLTMTLADAVAAGVGSLVGRGTARRLLADAGIPPDDSEGEPEPGAVDGVAGEISASADPVPPATGRNV